MPPLNLEKMSFAHLSKSRLQVNRLMAEKQASEKAALRQKMAEMAEAAGMSLDAVLGKGRKAPKYRDPKNPENPWTGRGRMPLWMAAAIRGNKAKKEDFLI
jgi:DNA-binding protein H-NS